MEKKRITNMKIKEFFKKNIYYFIIVLCLAAVATMITLTVLNNQDNNPIENVVPNPVPDIDGDDKNTDPDPVTPDPDRIDPVTPGPDPITPEPMVFVSPVSNVNILKDFTIDTLVWNSTLKQNQICDCIIFGGTDGDNVTAVADGEIINVTYDRLNGNVVTIKHSDELTTMYSSLNEPSVAIGDKVVKGDVIGTMGNTATNEYLLGAQLQFRAYEDGTVIDPNLYLAIGDK